MQTMKATMKATIGLPLKDLVFLEALAQHIDKDGNVFNVVKTELILTDYDNSDECFMVSDDIYMNCTGLTPFEKVRALFDESLIGDIPDNPEEFLDTQEGKLFKYEDYATVCIPQKSFLVKETAANFVAMHGVFNDKELLPGSTFHLGVVPEVNTDPEYRQLVSVLGKLVDFE